MIPKKEIRSLIKILQECERTTSQNTQLMRLLDVVNDIYSLCAGKTFTTISVSATPGEVIFARKDMDIPDDTIVIESSAIKDIAKKQKGIE